MKPGSLIDEEKDGDADDDGDDSDGDNSVTSNGSWCIGIKGEMSGTVCVTFTWYIYIYMSCL